tara:strand:- start:538 stop:822 length:285 start_codon:yes stop_codon:yes gene_type:complete
MNWKNYSSLKTAKNVAFEKVAEVKDADGKVLQGSYIVLVQKNFDSSTGKALDDVKQTFDLSALENEKARYDKEIAEAKAQSDELAKAIADFKKL